jgi:hypothetical protein
LEGALDNRGGGALIQLGIDGKIMRSLLIHIICKKLMLGMMLLPFKILNVPIESLLQLEEEEVSK